MKPETFQNKILDGGKQHVRTILLYSYNILFTQMAGFFKTSQRGEESSRAIVLVISEPELSDAGLYTCGVNGTSKFATVLITVEDPNGECRNSDFFIARCS